MKKFGKYFVLLAAAILTISAIVTLSNVYIAKGATNLSTESPGGSAEHTSKTIKLFDNQIINQSQGLNSRFVNIQGYKKIALYLSEMNSPGMSVEGQFSIDGINGYTHYVPDNSSPEKIAIDTLRLYPAGEVGNTRYIMIAEDVLGPSFRVSVQNGSDPAYPASATVSATLYLT